MVGKRRPWQAIFYIGTDPDNSAYTYTGTLDSLSIGSTADSVAPPNPTSVVANNQNGGEVILTSGNWYNYNSP
jgi:hypothetical protein